MMAAIATIEKLLSAAARRFVAPDEADTFATLSMQAHLKKAPRMNPVAEAVADLKVWGRQSDRHVANTSGQGGRSCHGFQRLGALAEDRRHS